MVRIFFTSLFAFLLSAFAGGLVAQGLAVSTNAGEEYILVFMAVVVLSVMFALPFFVAQFSDHARRWVDRAAILSCAVAGVLIVMLAGFEFWINRGDLALMKNDGPVAAGLVLPGLAIIMVQWLFVRWRVGAS